MRLRLFLFLWLFPALALAQFTTVTATVTTLQGATYTFDFVNQASGGPPLLGGISVFPTTVTGAFDASGHLSVSLADNNQVIPIPSQWKLSITLCKGSASGPIGFNIQQTITGTTVDLSSALTAALPSIPTGCNGGGGGSGSVQPAPQFRIFIQPNSGTQAVAGPASTSQNAVTPILQNQYSAALFQTSPGSNDGITNAITVAGANGTTFASSDYSTAESALFPSPVNASFLDNRSGSPNLWVHNPTGSNNAATGFFGPNPTRNCLFDGAAPEASGFNCAGRNAVFLGPGTDIGNGLISNDIVQDDTVTSYRAGLTEARTSAYNLYRTGDFALQYDYIHYVPGWLAGGDEGTRILAHQVIEATNMFIGTVTTGGAAAASVKIAPTSAGSVFNAGGNGQYTGGMLLDLTQVADSGTVTAMTQASGNTPGTFTTSSTHTASTVWGVTTTTIPDPTNVSITAWAVASNVATFTASNGLAAGQVIVLNKFGTNASFFNGMPVTVLSTGLSTTQFEVNFPHAPASGTDTGQATAQPYGQMEQFSIADTTGAFSVGDQVCIAGTVHGDETTIATTTGSGTQTVTARVSYPSAIGAFIVKGACKAITFSADFVSGVADPPYLIVGASDATHYWWANYAPNGRYAAGSLEAFNNRAVLPVAIPQLSFRSTTRTTNVVTMALNATGSKVQAAWLNNYPGVVISGCADSSFNGSFTPTVIVSPTAGTDVNLTYANAGADASTSGCVASLPPALAAYHVYPMAWVVDVVDPAVAGTKPYYQAPLTTVDGYLALARNSVTWNAADQVEEPHLPSAFVTDDYVVNEQNSPTPEGASDSSIEHIFQGTGNTGTYRPINFHQGVSLPFSAFQGLGGSLPPIQNYVTFSGAYSTMFNLPFAPFAGGSIMTVGCPAAAGDDPGTTGSNCTSQNFYSVFQNNGNGAAINALKFQPFGNTYEWDATSVHLPTASFTAHSIGLNGLDSGGFQIADPAILTQTRNHDYSSWGGGAVGDSSAKMGAGTYAAATVVVGAEIPTAVQVLNVGTAGTTTYTYVCTDVTAQGETLPSATLTTATGNAALNATNYNQVYCRGTVGTQSMNVYRTSVTGGLSAGKICSNVPVDHDNEFCNDTGQAAGAAVPTVDTSGKLLLSGVTITGNPTVGQIMTATSATTATWQNPASGIANVQIVLPVTALAANTCSAVITTTMTGVSTTSTFTSAFASDASGVTGYGSSGGLSIVMWPTANTNNLRLCNPTASSITPGAMTINVGAR